MFQILSTLLVLFFSLTFSSLQLFSRNFYFYLLLFIDLSQVTFLHPYFSCYNHTLIFSRITHTSVVSDSTHIILGSSRLIIFFTSPTCATNHISSRKLFELISWWPRANTPLNIIVDVKNLGLLSILSEGCHTLSPINFRFPWFKLRA